MVPRLAAVVLACVMTGMPVATTACQAACAEHAQAAAATGEQHSCAHETSAGEPVVTGSAHPCGHSDDSSNAIDRSLQTVHAPAAAVPLPLSMTPPVVVAVQALEDNAGYAGALILTSQLRI